MLDFLIQVDSLKVIDSLKSIIVTHLNHDNSLIARFPFLIGILTSMIASFAFIFLILYIYKPKLKISPFMCKGYLSDEPFPNQKYYFIKVVNKSFFSAYQISASIHKKKAYPTPPKDMKNNRLTPLDKGLVCDELNHLPCYRPEWLRKDAKHAFRFRTLDNLDDILKDETQTIVFEIKATHGLTGITKVFVEEYSHSSQIKDGTFTYGSKFGVLQ